MWKLGVDEEGSVAPNLFFAPRIAEPDVKAEADDVDVCGRLPAGAGVGAVRVAEGDVDSGKFFILEDGCR